MSSSVWHRCATGPSTVTTKTRFQFRSTAHPRPITWPFTWLSDLEALHVGCAFDLKVPERRRVEIQTLVAMINEQLWIGHFDLWNKESVVMFRHALLMAGGADPDGRQCEAILKMAITACDRYFQAFQFVLWAGKSAREALDGAMFETQGEA